MDTEKNESSVSENSKSSVSVFTSEKPDAANAENAKSAGNPEGKRDFFERVGDFFKNMTIGIFTFAFWKLPMSIWKAIKNLDCRAIIKRLYSIGRIIFWFSLWVLVIFIGWIAFALQHFLNFWRWVWTKVFYLMQIIWAFILNNIGPIWFVIAIIGSIYGLLYVTRNRWKLKDRLLNGVFSFLRRKRDKGSGENAGDGPEAQK